MCNDMSKKGFWKQLRDIYKEVTERKSVPSSWFYLPE